MMLLETGRPRADPGPTRERQSVRLPWLTALLMLPASAWADGLDLTWTDCVRGAAAQTHVDFNCAADVSYDLNFQFKSRADIPHFVSLTAVLDYQNETMTPLSPFWHYETAGCQMSRSPTGLAVLDDASQAPLACSGLADPWGGDGSQGHEMLAAYGVDFRRPGDGYFLLVDTRDQSVPIAGGVNYWALRLSFRTLWRAQCAGCSDAGHMLWTEARLESNDGSPPVILNSSDKLTNCVAINGGSIASCGIVAARTTTWGAIKSMYR